METILHAPTSLADQRSIKAEKLRKFFYSIIDSEQYKPEFSSLMKSFNVTKKDMEDAFLFYDMDIFGFDNSIYATIENRFVLHVHNLIKGSWHQGRQETIVEIINKIQPKSLIDIGFGVPSLYVRELVINKKILKVTLADYCSSAIHFSKALLELWDKNWNEMLSLAQVDMNHVELIGDYDVYMFQDTIEHATNPTGCLKKYVRMTPRNAQFIFSLPIGPIIPVHFMEWLSDDAAICWLEECGLKTTFKKTIYINPEVDLFAEPLGIHHHNLIVLCEKE